MSGTEALRAVACRCSAEYLPLFSSLTCARTAIGSALRRRTLTSGSSPARGMPGVLLPATLETSNPMFRKREICVGELRMPSLESCSRVGGRGIASAGLVGSGLVTPRAGSRGRFSPITSSSSKDTLTAVPIRSVTSTSCSTVCCQVRSCTRYPTKLCIRRS